MTKEIEKPENNFQISLHTQKKNQTPKYAQKREKKGVLKEKRGQNAITGLYFFGGY